MKITLTDKNVVTSISISIVLSSEREIQAFKNLLSWAEQGLFSMARYSNGCDTEHTILTELQQIKLIT